jgi:ATP-dependent phosphoenolpyruvate carboxykinase
MTMWMMNTGHVGGGPADTQSGRGLKIEIHHSSAMLEALIGNTIVWTRDPDFGYDVVDVDAPANRDLLRRVPAEILQPHRLFEAQRREAEYAQWARHMKAERRAFLRKHDVEPSIIAAVALE